jgi:glycosyltransferase involved in cell wall biosynthesis
MTEPRLAQRMLFLVGEPGGAERVDVADLFAVRLAGMGLQIDYIIFGTEPTGFWTEQEWRGARAFVIGRSPRAGISGKVLNKLIEVATDVRTFWQALTGSYDIIQVRDKFVVALLGLVAARIRGQRFCYWYSYPFAESRILEGEEGRARVPALSIAGGRVAKWLLYKVIMPRADHVFVQSQQMLEDVVAEGVPRELLTPVPMAVAEELLERAPADIAADTVLYLGTMGRVRRLDVLIEALALVREARPQARLIMVGDGPDAADLEYLQQRAIELGQADAVEFTGRMAMADAHARVACSAVCVSPFYPTPILQSTSPTKISEYMALGRPVVANTHPEQSAILAASGAGICVDWSAADFAAAIGQLLGDPVAAEALAARGRDYVREHRIYSVVAPPVAAEYARLFADVAE